VRENVFGECEKKRSEERFENSTTVKVTVGYNEFVKTKMLSKFKIIFLVSMFVTLLIPSIRNILQSSLDRQNINVR
jgi:hypothetical protein